MNRFQAAACLNHHNNVRQPPFIRDAFSLATLIAGGCMEQRTCYEVYRTATGWHARLDGLDEPIPFITREHALRIARAAALDRWQLEGRPSQVTVAEQDGRIVQDVSYDEDHSGDWLDESDTDNLEFRPADSVTPASSTATKLSLHAVATTA